MNFHRINEYALLIEFEQSINPRINSQVINLENAIIGKRIEGILETIPAYASLTVVFDPFKCSHDYIEKLLAKIIKSGNQVLDKPQSKLWKIPVCYDEEFGVDLKALAYTHGYSMEECIKFHSEVSYRVYMLGFMPGFLYLGGLDKRLITPRLSNPRTRIEEGSVAIGGDQTGIYALESPSGWNIIGKTPIKLFKASEEKLSPVKAGDHLKFYAISRTEFSDIQQQFESETLDWEDMS